MDIFDRLKAAAAPEWESYVAHPFVRRMADGTLPVEAFRTYLIQDYLFLIQFARAYALAVYKGRSLADMRAAQAGLSAILDVELDLHVRLSGRWGLSAADLEAAMRRTKLHTPRNQVTDVNNPILNALGLTNKKALEKAVQAAKMLPGQLGPEHTVLSQSGEWVLSMTPDDAVETESVAD